MLPAYPALAVLSAAFVDRWLREPACVPGWLMHLAWSALIAVGVGTTVGLPLARQFLPGEERIGLVGLIPLVGGVAAMLFYHRREHRQAIAAVAGMAAVLSVAIFGGIAVRASLHQNRNARNITHDLSGSDVQLATFAHAESSVVYYAQGASNATTNRPKLRGSWPTLPTDM